MPNMFQPTSSSSSSSSGSGKNYLSTYNNNTGNGDFELNSTTGWSLAHSSLTSAFPSTVGSAATSFSSAGGAHGGSSASGNLALTATSSSPIAGSFSGSYASSAATTAGDMLISDAFTIDTEDQAKVMTFKFYYKATSNPSNGNWSGTSSNSFGVAIYDVTGAAWIMPAGVWNLTQSSGAGYCTGTFQTTAASTQYQLAVFNANATSGAITLYFDDFVLGPQTAPLGPPITDWGQTAWTPTGSWVTNSTYTGFYKRVGDTFEGYAHIALAGAPTAASLTINLPTGLTIDTTKIPAVHAGIAPALGVGSGKSAGVAITFGVQYNSTTSVAVAYQSSTAAAATAIDATHPGTFANADYIDIFFTVPITGWSSNVSVSNDTDTRVCAMQVNGASTTVSGAYATLQWSTIINDTHGSMGSTLFTIPISGYYRFSAQSLLNGTQSLNGTAAIQIRKNATTVQEYSEAFAGAVTGSNAVGIVLDAIKCNAGDTIDVQVKSSATGPAVVSSTSDNYFTVSRLSGPAVVAAVETVAASYSTSAAQSIANGTTIIAVNFGGGTKAYDTHAAFGTTAYTIPVSGKYHIAAQVQYASATFTAGGINHLCIMQNSPGAETWAICLFPITTTASQSLNLCGTKTISCVAGDTVSVGLVHAESAGRALTGFAIRNWIDITRVGN